MTVRRILVLNGHPDPRAERLAAALAKAYCGGAAERGHDVRRLDVGRLDFPLIRSEDAFRFVEPPAAIRDAQADVAWAEHLVLIFPLWLGGAPAVLKGFLEQVFRYGFAIGEDGPMKGLLTGKSVRVIVTMGMPAPVFRLVFGSHGLKALERGVFWMSGMRRIRHTLIGGVGSRRLERPLAAVKGLGWAGA